jgi:hypothetical protein
VNKPRIFLGSSGQQARLLQAIRVRPGRLDHDGCGPVRPGIATPSISKLIMSI